MVRFRQLSFVDFSIQFFTLAVIIFVQFSKFAMNIGFEIIFMIFILRNRNISPNVKLIIKANVNKKTLILYVYRCSTNRWMIKKGKKGVGL